MAEESKIKGMLPNYDALLSQAKNITFYNRPVSELTMDDLKVAMVVLYAGLEEERRSHRQILDILGPKKK